MNTGAVIMMIIGCGGLWGGCLAAVLIALKHGRKTA